MDNNKKIINKLHSAITTALNVGMSVEDINEIRYREAKPGIRAEQLQKLLKSVTTPSEKNLMLAEKSLCETISMVTYLIGKDDKFGMEAAQRLDAVWNASWGKSNLSAESMILYRIGPRTK